MRNNRIMRGLPALAAVVVVLIMTATSAFALADGDAEQKTTTPAATETTEQKTTSAATETPGQEIPPTMAAVQEREPSTPAALTPNGNLTLVDDIPDGQSADKQFVTVITKNGNYFYLVIDRAGDTENVHFLNLVDESDLMALIGEEAPAPPAAPPATEEQTEPQTEPEPAPEPEKKNGVGAALGLTVILALLGGGAFFYFKVIRPKKGITGNADISELDGYDFGDDDDGYTETPDTDGYGVTQTDDYDGTQTDDGETGGYNDAGAYEEISFETDGRQEKETDSGTGGQTETEDRE